MTDRRTFLRDAALLTGGGAPLLLPGYARAEQRPGNRITLGYIGVGRQARGEMREMLARDDCQVVAVCDPDQNRMKGAKASVEHAYANRSKTGSYTGCAMIEDFRELVARPDIDAVLIYTPDHWHAIPAIEAARAGKDIFLQKPMSLTIAEGRVISDTVRRFGSVYITGSQQRSDSRFRFACELVRNQRIGRLHTVKVGVGVDPGTGIVPPMPVPEGLNYDLWLGPAPWRPYTERRVHPQHGYGRPGWLRCHDTCVGMFTAWGSHHMDIAHWGMGTELTGPIEISGSAEYPTDGLWDVHGPFEMHYKYANGVDLTFADNRKVRQGVEFIGTEGSVYVRRGHIDATPSSLLRSAIGPDEIHLYRSNSHKGNWIECMRKRAETVAPVEVGHRSCTACILADIASRVPGVLHWDPDHERFTNSDEANRMVSRPTRAPWRL